MRKSVLIATMLLATAQTALAHIEIGTYVGTTGSAPCSLTAIEEFFENGLHHPLAERYRIQVDGVEFVVGHPSVIDAATGTASFNHDLFQGVLPTPTGAKALLIDMVHEPGREGPASYQLIDHQWRSDTRAVVRCQDLKFQP